MLAANTYDIRYSVDGSGTWTEITGLTASPYAITGLAGCETYEVQMRSSCDGTTTTDWSASIVVVVPGCGVCTDIAYCQSIGGSTSDEWIDRVQVGDIDNLSGNNEGYAIFAEQGTEFVAGTAYPITLTPGYAGFQYLESWSVWIDFDLDGQFSDPAEKVFQVDPVAEGVTGELLVPLSAPLGASRMRVIMKFSSAVADGCEDDYDYGETEDYCVSITGPSGLAESGKGVAHLFPNPADNSITLALPADLGGRGMLEVFDNTGKVLLRQPLTSPRTLVDTARLAGGLYMYRVSNGQDAVARGTFEVAHD